MKINKPDPFQKGLADAMEKYEGKTLKVTYNSATGLFTNQIETLHLKMQMQHINITCLLVEVIHLSLNV